MFVGHSVCTANILIFDSCTNYWSFVQDEAITIWQAKCPEAAWAL